MTVVVPGAQRPRKLHAEALNWTTFKAGDLYGRSGQATTQNFIGFNYRLGAHEGVSVRENFVYGYEFPKTEGVSSDVHTRDVYFEYQNSRLFELWTDAKVMVVAARIGIPTGEESHFITGTQGWLWGWLEMTKPVTGRLNFNWHLRPQWYNQSRDMYVNSDGVTTENKSFGFDQWPELEYKFNSNVSVTHSTGTTVMWYRPGFGAQGRHDLIVSSWTALNIQANDQMAISFALSDDADLNPADRGFGLYRNDETQFHVILSALL